MEGGLTQKGSRLFQWKSKDDGTETGAFVVIGNRIKGSVMV